MTQIPWDKLAASDLILVLQGFGYEQTSRYSLAARQYGGGAKRWTEKRRIDEMTEIQADEEQVG
jgi:hypothetical protein